MFQKTYVQTFQSLLCMLPVAVVEFFWYDTIWYIYMHLKADEMASLI